MASILFLGFFIGMHHTLEADHVAAVASISSDESSVRRIVKHGVVWGMGHTLTLLVFGGGAVMLGAAMPETLAHGLETAVGVMLIFLGGHVLILLACDRVHFHLHRHHNGVTHLHAHSHRGEPRRHDPDRHQHAHPGRLPLRTLLVGMMHGMASSPALLVLTAASVGPAPLGLLYVVFFRRRLDHRHGGVISGDRGSLGLYGNDADLGKLDAARHGRAGNGDPRRRRRRRCDAAVTSV